MMKSKQSLFLAQKKILKDAGCEDYNKSTKLLFSTAFKIPLAQSYEYHTYVGSTKNSSLFMDLVSRRAVGEPISHIVNSKAFWKNDFYINETVLDPRPESELIIDITKDLLFDGMRVLDLGCGSGCIGISLYKENPNISLFLADSSKQAIRISKKNAAELKTECELIHSFLFANISGKFDLIVTNLPYISKGDFFFLQKEIILYEPHEALYGGVSGLDAIKLFLSAVSRYLNENGVFVIEFGKGQDVLLKKELLKVNFDNFEFHQDFNKVKRLVCVKKDT